MLTRLTAARLNPDLDWADVFGVAVLAGIGFAVPLLVSDVTFGPSGRRAPTASPSASLATALVAAIAGRLWLRLRHRHYERLYLDEDRDDDNDVPDVSGRGDRGQTDPQSDR